MIHNPPRPPYPPPAGPLLPYSRPHPSSAPAVPCNMYKRSHGVMSARGADAQGGSGRRTVRDGGAADRSAPGCGWRPRDGSPPPSSLRRLRASTARRRCWRRGQQRRRGGRRQGGGRGCRSWKCRCRRGDAGGGGGGRSATCRRPLSPRAWCANGPKKGALITAKEPS
jgi:hypothetical protein